MKTNSRRCRVALVSFALVVPLLGALENDAARRTQLKKLHTATRLFADLNGGKAPTQVSQLLDENLLDGPADVMRPGASVPPRAELDTRSDYTLEALPGATDMVIREKSPLPGESEVLAIFKDGTIRALPPRSSAPVAGNPPAPRAPALPEKPIEPPAGPDAGTASASTTPKARGERDAQATESVRTDTEVGVRGSYSSSDRGPVFGRTGPTDFPAGGGQPPSPPIPRDPQRFSQLIDIASAAYEQGDFARAREAYAGAVRENAGSVDALINLGRCHNALGELDAAIASFERVQRAAPARPNVRAWLADLHVAKGNLAAARKALEAELREHPNSAWAWCWLGTVELEAGDRATALQHCARAMQMDPRVAEERLKYCSFMGRTGQYARAAREAVSVIAMNPNQAGAYYAAGDNYARLGQREPAVYYFQRYLQYDSASEWAAYARQQIAQLSGRATP